MKDTLAGASPVDQPVRRLVERVTDADIAHAFEGTNFGRTDHKHLLALSVLKTALRYHCGHTVPKRATVCVLQKRCFEGLRCWRCGITVTTSTPIASNHSSTVVANKAPDSKLIGGLSGTPGNGQGSPARQAGRC